MALVLLAAAWTGCVGQVSPNGDGTPPEGPMRITSSSFEPGATIPQAYTCDGENVSPPLEVDGLPNRTRTVALVVGDPDVPTPETSLQNYAHWVLWNARPDGFSAFFPTNGTPNGSVEGANDAGGQGYTGPCPPVGSSPHRYVFTAFAVDRELNLSEGANRSQLMAALDGHVLARDRLVGLYERQANPTLLPPPGAGDLRSAWPHGSTPP